MIKITPFTFARSGCYRIAKDMGVSAWVGGWVVGKVVLVVGGAFVWGRQLHLDVKLGW